LSNCEGNTCADKNTVGYLLNWRRPENREQIFSHTAGLRKVKLGVAKWPEMEDMVVQQFLETRPQGKPVRVRWFRKTTRECFIQCYPERDVDDVCFSTGWFLNFLSRNAISFRVPTNTGQKIPADYQMVVINFIPFIRRKTDPRCRWIPLNSASPEPPIPLRKIGCVPICRLGNMDPTPLPCEFLDEGTSHEPGTQLVQIKSTKSGCEKPQATIMVTSFGDGTPHVRPVIIFKRTPDEELKRPGNARKKRLLNLEEQLYDCRDDVVVWWNTNGYCNEQVLIRYLRDYFLPALDPASTPRDEKFPSLLALDAARFHRTRMSRARTGHRKRPAYEGRVRFGEPGRQQLHWVQDHEVQVLGSRETRITRIGFRETSRRSEAWEARQAPKDRKPGFDRMPVPCDISSTSLVAHTRWVTSYWQREVAGTLEVSRSPRGTRLQR
jgi:hypothetical protein